MCQLSTPFHTLLVIPRRCVGGRPSAIMCAIKRYSFLSNLHQELINGDNINFRERNGFQDIKMMVLGYDVLCIRSYGAINKLVVVYL
jgi:hypothetical protein